MSRSVESCPLWMLEPLRLPKACSWNFGIRGAPSLIPFWSEADCFGIRGAHSLVPLWSDVDLAVEGFLGNWAGLISLVILFLSFVRIKFPLDFAFYIRHPGRTVLSHLQTPEFCRNSKFFTFQETRMSPKSWTSRLRQRKQRPKISLPFNRTRKKTLLLRPETIAGVDCVKLSVQQSSNLTLMAGHSAVRRKRGPPSPLQAVDETSRGRFFRSTDISFWIKVRFRVVSAGGNQFRRFRLFFFLTAGTIHTGSIAARTRLWIYHSHLLYLFIVSFKTSLPQPLFLQLVLKQACLSCSVYDVPLFYLIKRTAIFTLWIFFFFCSEYYVNGCVVVFVLFLLELRTNVVEGNKMLSSWL